MKRIPQVLQRTVVVELGRPLPIEPAEPQEPDLCFRDVTAQPRVFEELSESGLFVGAVDRFRFDELEPALRIHDEPPIQRNVDTKVVQIDADPLEIGRSYPNTTGVVGDPKATLVRLNQVIGKPVRVNKSANPG